MRLPPARPQVKLGKGPGFTTCPLARRSSESACRRVFGYILLPQARLLQQGNAEHSAKAQAPRLHLQRRIQAELSQGMVFKAGVVVAAPQRTCNISHTFLCVCVFICMLHVCMCCIAFVCLSCLSVCVELSEEMGLGSTSL